MAAIPERKRNRDELQDLQRRNAFAVRPPIKELQAQAVNRFLLAVFYLLGLSAAGLMIRAISSYGPIDEGLFFAGGACAGVNILAALLIFWRKPRSRHHAAFLVIISLLVLVFGSVYYIEQFEQEAHDDAQGPTRY